MGWSQDFRYWSKNIPSGVVFTLTKYLDGSTKRVVLKGKNHGEQKNYGNGSIFCDLDDILKYMIST